MSEAHTKEKVDKRVQSFRSRKGEATIIVIQLQPKQKAKSQQFKLNLQELDRQGFDVTVTHYRFVKNKLVSCQKIRELYGDFREVDPCGGVTISEVRCRRTGRTEKGVSQCSSEDGFHKRMGAYQAVNRAVELHMMDPHGSGERHHHLKHLIDYPIQLIEEGQRWAAGIRRVPVLGFERDEIKEGAETVGAT